MMYRTRRTLEEKNANLRGTLESVLDQVAAALELEKSDGDQKVEQREPGGEA